MYYMQRTYIATVFYSSVAMTINISVECVDIIYLNTAKHTRYGPYGIFYMCTFASK